MDLTRSVDRRVFKGSFWNVKSLPIWGTAHFLCGSCCLLRPTDYLQEVLIENTRHRVELSQAWSSFQELRVKDVQGLLICLPLPVRTEWVDRVNLNTPFGDTT